MQVTELWRYPVKSIRGEQLETAQVGVHGIEGDRAWAIEDCSTGNMLTARREPELLLASAAVVDGDVVVTLPDGTETTSDADLSAWLGKDVALTRSSADSAGTFETPLDWKAEADWVAWTGPEGSFHDAPRSMVSLCSTGTPRDWDLQRFRQNIWLSAGDEVSLVGSKVAAGTAVLDVSERIRRCVMVTRPQPGVERDLSVLKAINTDMESFLGVGALVPQPGSISVGDRLTVEAATSH